jgi:hypothetical protein
MPKRPLDECSTNASSVSRLPEPVASSARDGAELARDEPNLVRSGDLSA